MKKYVLLYYFILCGILISAQNSKDSASFSTIYVMRESSFMGSGAVSSIFIANQAPFNLSAGGVVAFKVVSEGETSILAQMIGAGNFFCTLQVKRGNDYYVCLTSSDLKQQSKEYVANFLRQRAKEIERREENLDKPINEKSIKNYKEKGGQATCFLINAEGYVVTNFHCVEGAKEIIVKGLDGDFTTRYLAQLIASDPSNDLALLKISNKNLKFQAPVFGFRTSGVAQAEKVYAMGFPSAGAMGEEVKITEGIISAKSGVQGDISKFQISAAVNPGNSGGPLIDESGDLIGVIYAKSTLAESAGYAIKAAYLETFLKNCEGFTFSPLVNSIREKSLPDKVKELKNFVFIVETN